MAEEKMRLKVWAPMSRAGVYRFLFKRHWEYIQGVDFTVPGSTLVSTVRWLETDAPSPAPPRIGVPGPKVHRELSHGQLRRMARDAARLDMKRMAADATL